MRFLDRAINKNQLSIILGLFLLVLISGCGGGAGGTPPGPVQVSGTGELKQTIFSPLNDELEVESATYSSGTTNSPINTQIYTRYRDFGVNYDSESTLDAGEPYCRIGGSYRLEIENDARPGGGVYKNNVELYYCSTVLDLINKIQIPLSWQNSEMTLYCNDGANINFENINFDILTSNLNTYKVCILKNLDLDTKNTIIYGFEVGNQNLDGNEGELFDTGSGTGQIVQTLTLNEELSEKNLEETEKVLYYADHRIHCQTITTQNQDGEDIQEEVCSNLEAPTNSEAKNEIDTTYPENLGFTMINSNNGLSKAVYEVTLPVSYKYNNLVYTNNNNEKLYFEYDQFYTFYSLRDFSEELSVPVTNTFKISSDIPSFDLSRVALFRSFSDGRVVYGYETAARNLISNVQTSKPVYRIKVKSFTFTDNDCLQTLSSYGATVQSTYTTSSQTVACKTGANREVVLNSDKVDSTYGDHTSFNLFKNIILDME